MSKPGPRHNISFTLELDNNNATKTIFDALSAGGKVEMPLMESLFSPAYSRFAGRFGVEWQVLGKPGAMSMV